VLEGIEAIVFRTIGDCPPLWESRLPAEVLRLPEELARVDALLDDPAFFVPFAPHFHPVLGRPSTPIEWYLRLMFLKFRYRLGYESLCAEVSDSISWRRFCRIPLDGAVPHPTTLIRPWPRRSRGRSSRSSARPATCRSSSSPVRRSANSTPSSARTSAADRAGRQPDAVHQPVLVTGDQGVADDGRRAVAAGRREPDRALLAPVGEPHPDQAAALGHHPGAVPGDGQARVLHAHAEANLPDGTAVGQAYPGDDALLA